MRFANCGAALCNNCRKGSSLIVQLLSDGGLIEARPGEPVSPAGEGGYPLELVIDRLDANGRRVGTFGIHGRAVFRLEGRGELAPKHRSRHYPPRNRRMRT